MAVSRILALADQARAPDVVRETIVNAVDLQLDAMHALRRSLDGPMLGRTAAAVDLILNARGRVIVTGIGKSGNIGVKIASTLASTGTPAHFMHAADASHGDLGMVTRDDVILVLSWSGETNELSNVVQYATRNQVPLIAITSRETSTLSRHASVTLKLPRVREICQHGLAPSASTLVQLALGDALAIAASERRGFQASDFHERHPGGKLGALLLRASDLMASAGDMPLVAEDTTMDVAIVVMTEHRFGTVGVTDPRGALAGLITDGDIRRHMSRDFLDRRARDVMTLRPITISADRLATEVLAQMLAQKINVVFVVEEQTPIGILHIHDLIRAGIE